MQKFNLTMLQVKVVLPLTLLVNITPVSQVIRWCNLCIQYYWETSATPAHRLLSNYVCASVFSALHWKYI